MPKKKETEAVEVDGETARKPEKLKTKTYEKQLAKLLLAYALFGLSQARPDRMGPMHPTMTDSEAV